VPTRTEAAPQIELAQQISQLRRDLDTLAHEATDTAVSVGLS
jgi:hypothetical protein